jgi:hypothetical protein
MLPPALYAAYLARAADAEDAGDQGEREAVAAGHEFGLLVARQARRGTRCLAIGHRWDRPH